MSDTQSPSTQSLVKLTLVDTEQVVVRAWKQEFADFPEVAIAEGDILELATNCVVSPANSYGYIDGGIDRDYVDFFGSKLQMVVQDAIAKRPEGYLPVGAAIVIATGNPRIPHMICAPTMLLPQAPEQNHLLRPGKRPKALDRKQWRTACLHANGRSELQLAPRCMS